MNLLFYVGLITVGRDLNQYKIVVTNLINFSVIIILICKSVILNLRSLSRGGGGGGGGGGGERERDGRRYIFLWLTGAETFQIIWVIGVRITWLEGEERILSPQKSEKFYLI